jgi:hypothetical protein
MVYKFLFKTTYNFVPAKGEMIANILPETAVIIGPAEIFDMSCITKWVVFGGGNFSYQGEKNERTAGGTIRKTSDQKVLICSG